MCGYHVEGPYPCMKHYYPCIVIIHRYPVEAADDIQYFSRGNIIMVLVVDRRTTNVLTTKELPHILFHIATMKIYPCTGQKFTVHQKYFAPKNSSLTVQLMLYIIYICMYVHICKSIHTLLIA